MKRMTSALAIACVFAVSAGGASAAPLAGKFNFAGSAPVRVGPDYIDWGEAGPIFGTPMGDIVFTFGEGSFSGLALEAGTVLDLTSANSAVGVPINLPNFLTADTEPTWDFTLTYIAPGVGTVAGCTAALGAVCTPLGSPFTIVNLGSSVAIAMEMSGTVTDGAGPSSTWSATYSTQLTGYANAAAVLAALSLQGGYVESSYSAEVTAETTAVPEPVSGFLLGTGLLLASMVLRRRQ
jgi:hypothetical protein